MTSALEQDPAFDYRTAPLSSILARASLLRGHVLGDIVGARFTAAEPRRGKHEVGAAIEHFFGIPSNSRSEADFSGARIELKVVPLVRVGSELRVKERTVISMIDYEELILERWGSATVRKKLNILFIFFEHIAGLSKAQFPILLVVHWQPDHTVEGFIEADWQRVRRKIRLGLADELSESDGTILGPCRKGADAQSMRRQPFSSTPAKSRAFALKPSFTRDVFQRNYRPPSSESLIDNGVVSLTSGFEEQLLQRFHPFEGDEVGAVAERLGIPPSNAKSFAARVLRRMFGARDFRSEIVEFTEMGLTPRMSRVDENLQPYEALSFPAFRYAELLDEDWEDSDLLSRVEYMLIVPVFGRTRRTPQAACRFGRPVFWRPSAAQLETMRREWELYRLEIRNGQAKTLTPASETDVIHVRPHARNGADVDVAPVVGPVVKKSFWLNQPFVRGVLADGARRRV